MQFIRSHEIFRLLLDLTVLVCRYQLGRDGGIHNVKQCVCSHLTSDISHQMTDERLRNTRIHTVHRHVVAVIGRPSQSEFREVTSTHDNGILLVGHIHQDLRTLAGL